MEQDISEKRLEGYNDVFADIYNALVFGGREILKEEKLVPLPTETFTERGDGSVRQGNRDICKADDCYGQYRLICGLENQTGCDNTMPERVMGYDFAAYEEQIQNIMEKNKNAGNPAYTKRIHDSQKLAPVITTVLYFGEKEPWEKPRSLHDMLDFSGGLEKIKPYVADYPLNIISLANLSEEERGRLKSDFRLVAEYAACGGNLKKFKEIVDANRQQVKHPRELFKVLGSLGKKNKEWTWEDGNKEKKEETEEISMLNLWDQIFDDGVEQGIEQGIERVNTLNCRLIKEKRYGDLERASKDPEYRKALFKLYGIGPQKHENRKRIVSWREIED